MTDPNVELLARHARMDAALVKPERPKLSLGFGQSVRVTVNTKDVGHATIQIEERR